jgi:hypothetical protein
MALLTWLLPVFHPDANLTPPYTAGFTIAIAIAVGVAWAQARQYKRYQVEELAATAAYWDHRCRTQPRPDATSQSDPTPPPG